CDFSGTTSWTNEGDCGGSEEFDSVTGTPTIGSGVGVAAAAHSAATYGEESWTNTDNPTTHYKFKFKTDEIDGNDDADFIRLLFFVDGSTGICYLAMSGDNSGTNKGKLRTRCDDIGGDASAYTSTAIVENTEYWIGVSIHQHATTGWTKIWITTTDRSSSSFTGAEREVFSENLDTSNDSVYIDKARFGISYNNMDHTVTATFDDFQVDDDTAYGADP
ncbi:unnamed protein product, partial [marine sediment metagenome]